MVEVAAQDHESRRLCIRQLEEKGICGAGVFVNLLKRDIVLQTRFRLEAAMVPEFLWSKYP